MSIVSRPFVLKKDWVFGVRPFKYLSLKHYFTLVGNVATVNSPVDARESKARETTLGQQHISDLYNLQPTTDANILLNNQTRTSEPSDLPVP